MRVITMRATVAGAIVGLWLAAAAASQRPELVSIYLEESLVSRGARPEAYEVSVDGVSVPVVRLTGGPHPISAVVLFDTSPSTANANVSLPDAARRLAKGVLDDDTLRIGTFGSRILLSPPLGRLETAAPAAAREVAQQGGPSPLWDAMHASVKAVAQAAGLRAVLVFTDAMATGNDHAFSEIEEIVLASGVIVSAVGISDVALARASSIHAVGRNDALRRIAEGSGGAFIELKSRTDSPTYLLTGMVDQMRKRYRIDFVPPVRDGAVHQISVTSAGRPIGAPIRIRY